MKIIGIIPARYESSRLPGKPIVDICGKPMIWWVYHQALKVKGLEHIYVAVDNEKVAKVCEKYDINYIMTANDHPTHMHRLQEVAQKITADIYICICGDEPLIEPHVIEALLPDADQPKEDFVVRGVCRELTDPAETLDTGNIKIITNDKDQCLSLSRTPIPNPYKTVEFKYKKTIGIECFNKKAIDFYCDTTKGNWEAVEDIMMLRFLEQRIPSTFKLVESSSLSVDTGKDLEKVRNIMSRR